MAFTVSTGPPAAQGRLCVRRSSGRMATGNSS
jgi:hypothetical protein